MTKKISRMTSAVVLIVLVLCLSSFVQEEAVSAEGPQIIDVYIKTGVIDWKKLFNEPFEIIYLIFYDSKITSITTRERDRININATYVQEFIKINDYKISDIAIIVHNHFGLLFFSRGDKNFLKGLRRKGFKGSFGIYHMATGEMKWAKRDEMD